MILPPPTPPGAPGNGPAHAILPASDCDTWIVCPAKPLMVRNLVYALPVPEEHKRAADDGTASHWAMAEIAAERVVAEGQITPDGHVLSLEMIEGAQMLVDDVLATVPHIPRNQWRVEKRVYMFRLHRENWGTPDLWVFDPSTNTIYLWDYKFGHGIVEVFENWQLIDYLVGILDALGITDDRHVKAVLTIVQPRAYHPKGPVRRWSISDLSNLRGYWNRIEMAAEDALSGHARAVPNANCGYCEARHVCEALQRDAYRSADLAQESVPVLMSPVAVGTELSMLESALVRLTARVEGLKALGEDMAFRNQPVPGWRLGTYQSKRAFKDDDKSVAGLRSTVEMFGVSAVKDKPLTVLQVRDALVSATGMSPEDALAVVAEYVAPTKTVRKFERVNDADGRRMFQKF